jgi:hypothetical protein
MDDISLGLWCGRGVCSHCLDAKNHLLSHRIVIQGSAYDGSDLLLKITMLLSVSERLGISLDFLFFFLMCGGELCKVIKLAKSGDYKMTMKR